MLFTKLKSQVQALLRILDAFLDSHVDIALSITTEIKKAIASPGHDIVTAVLTDYSEEYRRKIVSALDQVITLLAIKDSCTQYTEINDKLLCFAKQLQQSPTLLQDAILQKMASVLASVLDNQRLGQYLYDLFTQLKYTVLKPGK